jgi:hypothetical protein
MGLNCRVETIKGKKGTFEFPLWHPNGCTKTKKMGVGGMWTKEKDSNIIAWTLVMQECGLSILLHQRKMKVVKLT